MKTKKEKLANSKDIELLKRAINDLPIDEGWYYDVNKLIRDSNIKRFYQVREKSFPHVSVGYVLTKDNRVVLLKHLVNDVNTSYLIASLYRESSDIKNNFYWLYDTDLQ